MESPVQLRILPLLTPSENAPPSGRKLQLSFEYCNGLQAGLSASILACIVSTTHIAAIVIL